jgi:hypothetical protein
MSSKKAKGRVGSKQNWPRQLQNHTIVEPKSNQVYQVVEAATSANRADKGGGDTFLVRGSTTSAIYKGLHRINEKHKTHKGLHPHNWKTQNTPSDTSK